MINLPSPITPYHHPLTITTPQTPAASSSQVTDTATPIVQGLGLNLSLWSLPQNQALQPTPIQLYRNTSLTPIDGTGLTHLLLSPSVLYPYFPLSSQPLALPQPTDLIQPSNLSQSESNHTPSILTASPNTTSSSSIRFPNRSTRPHPILVPFPTPVQQPASHQQVTSSETNNVPSTLARDSKAIQSKVLRSSTRSEHPHLSSTTPPSSVSQNSVTDKPTTVIVSRKRTIEKSQSVSTARNKRRKTKENVIRTSTKSKRSNRKRANENSQPASATQKKKRDPRSLWSQEEIDALKKAAQGVDRNDVARWNKIYAKLPADFIRSKKAVKEYWYNHINPEERWDKKEEDELRAAVLRFNKDWKKIDQIFPSREKGSAKRHWVHMSKRGF